MQMTWIVAKMCTKKPYQTRRQGDVHIYFNMGEINKAKKQNEWAMERQR